jgi:hypothetical protein
MKDTFMSKIKDALIEQEERDAVLGGLTLWSAINEVASAVVSEVRETSESKTLDQLYDKIKELYTK